MPRQPQQLPAGLTIDAQGRFRIQFASHSRPGQRYRERLPIGETAKNAKVVMRKRREDDRLDQLLWPHEREQQSAPQPGRATVDEYASAAYLPYSRARNAPRTMDLKINSLANVAPWFGHVALDDVTPQIVYTFQAERKAEGVRGRTVNLEWGVVRHLLNHAHRTGARSHPPPQVEALPTTDSRESRALDVEEATRALGYARDRSPMWYACTMMLLHTGARWSDLVGLRWVDVDLGESVVTYRAEVAKQSRDREVPLVPVLVDALRMLPQSHEMVFTREHRRTGELITLHRKAKAIGDHYPWESKERDCGFGAHTWRHTFASWKLREGVSIALVSRWLGHASIQLTVDRYGHIEPRDHREEIMRGPQLSLPRLRVVGEE